MPEYPDYKDWTREAGFNFSEDDWLKFEESMGRGNAYHMARRLGQVGALGGVDEFGFTGSGVLPGEGAAPYVQYLGERAAYRRNQRLGREAFGHLQQGISNLQTYRPGGASALLSPFYTAGANTLLSMRADAPDSLFKEREHQQHKEKKTANRAGWQSLAGSLGGALIGAGGSIAGGALAGGGAEAGGAPGLNQPGGPIGPPTGGATWNGPPEGGELPSLNQPGGPVGPPPQGGGGGVVSGGGAGGGGQVSGGGGVAISTTPGQAGVAGVTPGTAGGAPGGGAPPLTPEEAAVVMAPSAVDQAAEAVSRTMGLPPPMANNYVEAVLQEESGDDFGVFLDGMHSRLTEIQSEMTMVEATPSHR